MVRLSVKDKHTIRTQTALFDIHGYNPFRDSFLSALSVPTNSSVVKEPWPLNTWGFQLSDPHAFTGITNFAVVNTGIPLVLHWRDHLAVVFVSEKLADGKCCVKSRSVHLSIRGKHYVWASARACG